MGGLEEGVVERQFLHLARGHLGQFVAAIAEIHAPQTGHGIQNLVALAVGQRDALRPG